MNTTTKSNLLAQIAQIQLMERGKLSTYTFKDRSAPTAPYYKLQCWEHGKNATRYIRAEQVPLLEQALAGHARFQELSAQYAQIVIDQTRQQLSAVGSKKKKSRRPSSSWPKSRRSSN
jgi:hypothetical protein